MTRDLIGFCRSCIVRLPFLFVFLTTGIAIFVFTPIVFAATEVTENISTDATWVLAGSPYHLPNGASVLVLTGATLTIEPGVVVKFGDDSSLNIDGILNAFGSSGAPIIFTSLFDDVGGDTNGDGGATFPSSFDLWWLNFYGLNGSPTSTLRYATIRNVQYGPYVSGAALSLEHFTFEQNDSGFYLDSASALEISDSTLGGTYGDMISADGGSTITVERSTMHDVFSGDVFGLYNGSTLLLSGSRIENIGNGSAIGLYSAHATTTESIISGGLDSALEPYDGSSLTVIDSTVEDFASTGVYPYESRVLIQDSIIRGNDYGVYASGAGSDVRIINSVIADNVSYGVYDDDGSPTDARGNFWGDATGPFHPVLNPSGFGDTVSDNVDFSGWLPSDPLATVECCSSVAFIPGIKGSRLYKAEGGSENRLWEPNRNADVEKLFMNLDGASVDPTIYTRDIVDSAYGFVEIYEGFTDFMNGLVSDGTIAGWRALSYDWRLAPDEVVRKGVETGGGNISYLSSVPEGELPFMIKEIEELAASSQNGKVTLVTHSNGGLVAKSLLARLETLKALGESNLVDKIDRVIMVAAPQLGTPSTIASMLHGDDEFILGGFFLNKQTARLFAENAPAAYTLLPSAKYFDVVSDPVVTFSDDIGNAANFSAYAPNISSFAELGQFFLAVLDGRSAPAFGDTATPNVLNPALLAAAESFHAGADTYEFPSGVSVTEIAGWGLDTTKGIHYDASRDCPIFCDYELEREAIITFEGDGVVVYPSAVASGATDYYFNFASFNNILNINREHKDILEASPVRTLLENLLVGNTDLPNHITDNKPILPADKSSLRLSVFSPITIDAYDSTNLHTGLITNPIPDSDLTFFEEQIPNSYYEEFGEGKTIGLDSDDTYSIVMNGTGYGTFSFEKEERFADGTATTSMFTDLPVTPITIAEVNIAPEATTTVVKLDMDGDGDFDYILQPSAEFDPILFLQSLKSFVLSLDLPDKIEKFIIKKIDKVLKEIEKGKIKNAGKKIKTAIKIFSYKKGHFKKIPREDLNSIIIMLNQLLDNLK